MARKKSKGTELSVFKGREARLNRAILIALARESELTIYDVTKAIKNQKGLRHTKYTNVNRRVKALESQGYIQKAGTRNILSGAKGNLYQLTTKAHVALILNQINIDTLLSQADEQALTAQLAALLFFINSERKGA